MNGQLINFERLINLFVFGLFADLRRIAVGPYDPTAIENDDMIDVLFSGNPFYEFIQGVIIPHGNAVGGIGGQVLSQGDAAPL